MIATQRLALVLCTIALCQVRAFRRKSDKHNDSQYEHPASLLQAAEEARQQQLLSKTGKGGYVMMAGKQPTQEDGNYWRPNYLKHERCESETDCEECAPGESDYDCIKPDKKDMKLKPKDTNKEQKDYLVLDVNDGKWKKFRTLYEIKCPVDKREVDYHVYIETKYTDNWAVYQNGEKLSGYTKKNKYIEINFDVSGMEKGDVMELQFEFTNPQAGQTMSSVLHAGYLYIWGLWSVDPTSNVNCGDNQACLKTLSRSVHARHFRNNNHMQLDCLQGQSLSFQYQTVCNQWRDCLSADMEAGIKHMIQSAFEGEPGGGSYHWQDYQPGCINPAYTDPEGWACNCMEEWVARCNGQHSDTCYTNAYCASNLVCLGWKKKANCPGVSFLEEGSSSSVNMSGAAQQVGILLEVDALQGRALAQSHDAQMDQAMGSKGCV